MTELNIEGEGKCSLQKAGKRGGGGRKWEREKGRATEIVSLSLCNLRCVDTVNFAKALGSADTDRAPGRALFPHRQASFLDTLLQ